MSDISIDASQHETNSFFFLMEVEFLMWNYVSDCSESFLISKYKSNVIESVDKPVSNVYKII